MPDPGSSDVTTFTLRDGRTDGRTDGDDLAAAAAAAAADRTSGAVGPVAHSELSRGSPFGRVDQPPAVCHAGNSSRAPKVSRVLSPVHRP